MIKLFFALIFAVALVLFASENMAPVKVRFLVWQSQTIPLAVLIIMAVVAGALLMFIAMIPIHHRIRKELSKHRKELETLREEGN
ncbi:MAG: LapA family protein [Elusimicrobiota bacterium]|jgi:uncharacterized integral membrane protein